MAVLGSLVAVSFGHVSHRGLCNLISFAAGALLAVALFHIFPETFDLIGHKRGVASILSGYLLFFLVNKFVFHICPACAATHTEVNFKSITLAMMAALSVHSAMDGLAIYSGSVPAARNGLLILIAVAFHKLPEGMALSLVARSSGMSRTRAFWLAVSLETVTTLAGALAGIFFLSPTSLGWEGYVMGHIGGGFIFLVVHAILSEVFKHHPRATLISAGLGAGSIGLIGFLIGAF